MILFIVFLFVCYTAFIIYLSLGFKKVDYFKIKNSSPKTKFSIIIPFRNEAENLPKLLATISKINYPKELFEIIFVDDDSFDNSREIIENTINSNLYNYSIIKNKRFSNSPKKDAITSAISVSKFNWIITTDADCLLPKKWLTIFDDFVQQNNPKMIIAPVIYFAKETFLEQFQLLDFMSLQGTTIGGFGNDFPFLCNGANLAYKKDAFISLNGFENNNNIASGDDIFLFEKFLNTDKKNVQYLKSKDIIVTTFPEKNWKSLINQRTRWAAKTGNLKSLKIKLIGFLVILLNFSLITSFFIFSIELTCILFSLKMLVDLFLFIPTTHFFNYTKPLKKWYIISSFLYPFFSVLIILNSLFFKYRWKGREFKK